MRQFFEIYKFICRGTRLLNWSCVCQTQWSLRGWVTVTHKTSLNTDASVSYIFSYLSFIPSFESSEWEICFPCDGSDALPWTWLWHWVRFDECIWVPRQQKTLFPAPKRCPVASPPASSVNVSLFKLLVDICLASDSTAVLLTLSWNKVWYTFFRKLLHFSWILHS